MVTALTLRPSFSRQLGDGLVDGPDVFQGAVDVHALGAGEREPGGVRTGGDHQFVVCIGVAGSGFNGLGRGVDLHDTLAGLQVATRGPTWKPCPASGPQRCP